MKKISRRITAALAISMLLVLCAFSSETNVASSAYSDYFSQERIYEKQVDDPTLSDKHVFIYSEDCVYGEIPGLVSGYLYKHDFDTDEWVLLVDKQVMTETKVNDRIFYSSGNTVYSIDQFGEDEEIVLTASGTITHMEANDTLIYYVADDIMYRHFIPSQITDYFGDVTGIVDFIPISNYSITWSALNPNRTANPDDGDTFLEYFLNGQSQTEEALTGHEWTQIVNDLAEQRASAPNISTAASMQPTYQINYKTVPFAAYPLSAHWG